jgi:hypothetical protein
VLGDRQIVWTGRSLGEDAHFVDEIGHELAAPDLEYLNGLPRGLERGPVADGVARRPVSIYQCSAFRFETNV